MTVSNNRLVRAAALGVVVAVFAASLAAASALVAVGSVGDGEALPNLDGAESDGAHEPIDAAPSADAVSIESRLSDERSDDEPDVAIRDAGYEGLAVIRIAGGVTHLFEDEPHRLELTVATGAWSGDAEVCVWIPDNGGDSRAVTCEPLGSLDDRSVTSETVAFESWMDDELGETTVRVTVVGNPNGDRQSLDEIELEVRALAKDEDISASGLTTEQELAYGTDFLRADTAGDGLTDGQELRETGTDPLARDTAGNGVPDGMEVILGTDPTNPWTPHIYLLLLAIFFGLGLVIFEAVAGHVQRLGRRWESDRPMRAEHRRPRGDASISEFLGRRPVDATKGGWPTSSSADDADRFITDEQRVVRLLERNGGRMPQSELVTETDWSKSKVSRLLSGMEENGTIAKIPIGRTNLVVLGGREEFAGAVVGEEV